MPAAAEQGEGFDRVSVPVFVILSASVRRTYKPSAPRVPSSRHGGFDGSCISRRFSTKLLPPGRLGALPTGKRWGDYAASVPKRRVFSGSLMAGTGLSGGTDDFAENGSRSVRRVRKIVGVAEQQEKRRVRPAGLSRACGTRTFFRPRTQKWNAYSGRTSVPPDGCSDCL